MLPPPAVFHFLWEINTDLVKDGASVRTYGRSVHLLKFSEIVWCDFIFIYFFYPHYIFNLYKSSRRSTANILFITDRNRFDPSVVG